jgi:tripartite-type tricarboxylate transporter receptor subunit TctC
MRCELRGTAAICFSALLIAGSPPAQASYPEKTIHMVVGFPSGSAPDAVARLLGQKLAEALGKPVVVENIPGAAANIAAERIAKAAPDGYTLGLLGQSIVVNPSLYQLKYDPVKDFAPVSQVAVSPYILIVHNAVPAKSVGELVALAKARPGELTFASGGSGSATHIAAELFKSAAGLDLRHIPYKGVVAAIPDVIGGRVTMMFSPIVGILPLAREGKLRALAVTGSKRSPAAAEFPTIAESGYPAFEFTIWYGLIAPAGTPEPVVRRLNLETVRALARPDLRDKLATLGLEEIGSSPESFAATIKSDIQKWANVIKKLGIKTD